MIRSEAMDEPGADTLTRQDLVRLAAGLVAAYLRGNRLSEDQVPEAIRSVHAALETLQPEASGRRPAALRMARKKTGGPRAAGPRS